MNKIKLNHSWLNHLEPEFNKDYMVNLRSFLVEEKKTKQTIFPESKNIFNALNSTSFEDVKVVILGQDPYHGPNQAHGLCFSVLPGARVPPSLRNIYKELSDDIGFVPPNHGHLQEWANQGVLLLNSVLTVRSGLAGSHQNKGWERFTDKVIANLNENNEKIVYMLWGSYAQKKGSIIDAKSNLVLKSVHPSPLSAHRGFFGCKHFSQCNNYLSRHGIEPIAWQLNELQ